VPVVDPTSFRSLSSLPLSLLSLSGEGTNRRIIAGHIVVDDIYCPGQQLIRTETESLAEAECHTGNPRDEGPENRPIASWIEE
jgi:hypothetical protein